MNIKQMTLLCIALLMGNSFAMADESGPTQQLEGFNLNGYTDTGKKSWEINGDKADISDDKIKVTNVNANFYDPKQNANLTSKTGTIDKINGNVHLQDDVVVTADRGTTMKTDSLDWKRNQDLVETKDRVRIEDEQGTVTATGLTGHPNLKKAQLNQDVKAVVKTSKDLAKSQTVEITCDGPMEMDQSKMVAIFNKNVVGLFCRLKICESFFLFRGLGFPFDGLEFPEGLKLGFIFFNRLLDDIGGDFQASPVEGACSHDP